MPRLHVLGSAGSVPTPKRATSAYLIETRRSAILLGCGGGVARLSDPMYQAVLARVPRVIVLLPNWHHAQIAGLPWLPHFLRDHEVLVAGPPAAVTGVSAAEAVARFGGAPFMATPMAQWGPREFPRGFAVVELRDGRNRVGGEAVDVVASPPTLSLRVREVVLAVDMVARPDTAVLAKGAGVLIHDAWFDDEDHPGAANAGDTGAPPHATATAAAALAATAGVKDLVLGHLNPAYDETRLERMLFAAATVFARTHVAADFRTFDVASAAGDEPDAVPVPAVQAGTTDEE